MMEKYVYPLESVGKYFNKNFICVKVQIDRTSRDNAAVKSWYTDAKLIEKEFSINSYPTYLFLSPDGKPLHRASGGFGEEDFLLLAKDALDTTKQSYTLANKYNIANMDTAELRKVAMDYRRANPEFASKLASLYFEKINESEILQIVFNKKDNPMVYLFPNDIKVKRVVNNNLVHLTEEDLLKRHNIDLMIQYSMTTSKDKGFRTFYQYSEEVDSILLGDEDFKRQIANSFIDNIIYKEEIDPILQKAFESKTNPNWSTLSATISKKYNTSYAYRAVSMGKYNWATKNKKTKEAAMFFNDYMEKYGKENTHVLRLNNLAWDRFLTSNDSEDLLHALSWSNRAITINPDGNYFDTYANLLYKLGKKKTAIYWMEIAAKLAPDNEEIQVRLGKMKKGLPTWPVTDEKKDQKQ
jgi:hypothetical protein